MFLRRLFFLLCVLPVGTFAQLAVRGVVTDQAGKPIPGASIYFNNTQIGTSSNDAGNFVLFAKENHDQLVVSCIGYETVRITDIDNGKRYKIVLQEISSSLKAVTISAKAKRNVKWESIFFRILMGGDSHRYPNSRILNPEVLRYDYDSGTQTLRVSNTGTIKINHPKLGYLIHVDILQFEYDFKNDAVLRETTAFYEEHYKRADQSAIQNSTVRAYRGSRRHFFTALANHNLEAEGFTLFKYSSVQNLEKKRVEQQITDLKLARILKGSNPETLSLDQLIRSSDTLNYYRQVLLQKDYLSRNLTPIRVDSILEMRSDGLLDLKLSSSDTLLVMFAYQSLTQLLKNDPKNISNPANFWETLLYKVDDQPTLIDRRGFVGHNNIMLVGAMSYRGLSDDLPADYDPKIPRFEKEKELFRSQ